MAAGRRSCRVALLAVSAIALMMGPSVFNFVSGTRSSLRSDATRVAAGAPDTFEDQYGKFQARAPLPKGFGIRTGLSDLLKPLNSEYGVTAKEDSIPTYAVMIIGIVLLFLFYLLLLLINNQSVLLPPEDEFDEYVANFLPYFFFGER
eukprot:CAMPEP_0170588912 /NCGR_PEP_ID=MMETSP0224-20130122/11081_1 /TAXON_ID=285029 /ORGANISM="Togula jolla, Strain CCCM 725" /LENGTH=147 /DNA_ID=CAMNT_0010912657 /DNA_START=45 /DNA_END=488 /DNA_ORIENTATION=+